MLSDKFPSLRVKSCLTLHFPSFQKYVNNGKKEYNQLRAGEQALNTSEFNGYWTVYDINRKKGDFTLVGMDLTESLITEEKRS